MLHTIAAFDRIGEENAFAVLARATALAAEGKDIVNLGIGQPDFKTPQHIVEAAIKALRDGHHGYTPANGLLATREAVVRRTLTTTGVEVSPENVMILPAASAVASATPSAGGRVRLVSAMPFASVIAVVGLTDAPGDGVNRTVTPDTGALASSRS